MPVTTGGSSGGIEVVSEKISVVGIEVVSEKISVV